MSQTLNILRIDASALTGGSTTRETLDAFLEGVRESGASVSITERNVAEGLPFVNQNWIGANFTPEEDRTDAQRDELALSDSLIAEIEAADILIIGQPIYNFGVPASLKAWIDLIARARKTFQYTENGPVGLLEGKKAYIAVASGGTQANSDIDFATPYLKHALGFIGIHDVTLIEADQQMIKGEEVKTAALKAARELGASLSTVAVAAE